MRDDEFVKVELVVRVAGEDVYDVAMNVDANLFPSNDTPSYDTPDYAGNKRRLTFAMVLRRMLGILGRDVETIAGNDQDLEALCRRVDDEMCKALGYTDELEDCEVVAAVVRCLRRAGRCTRAGTGSEATVELDELPP